MSNIVTRSRVLIGLSMAIFGTIGLFVRGIALPSSETALYRAVLAVLAIGSYLLATGQKLQIKGMRREILLLAASGIAMGFNWILLFEAYKYTTISMATLSYYAAPILITLVSTFAFHEALTPFKTLCFIMATSGILLITLQGGSAGGMRGNGTDHIGIFFGLGAAVLYASVVLLNKLIKNVAGIQRTFLQFVAAVVTLFPYVMLTGGIHLGGLNRTGWILLLIVGLLHTGVAYCMYFSFWRWSCPFWCCTSP